MRVERHNTVNHPTGAKKIDMTPNAQAHMSGRVSQPRFADRLGEGWRMGCWQDDRNRPSVKALERRCPQTIVGYGPTFRTVGRL